MLNVVPESLLRDVLNCALNQWNRATRYYDNGRLDIDNNRSERAIKPFVISKRAWLFSQTANLANASTALYSIVEIA
jgi:hypothetical protein